MADIAQLVGGGLHEESLVVDGVTSLSHRIYGIHDSGRSHAAPCSPGRGQDGDPKVAGRLVVALHGHVEDGVGDGSIE